MTARVSSVLPKAPASVLKYDVDLYWFLNRLVQQLEVILNQSPKGVGWQPTNTPTSGNRSIDADAATLQETSRCLARLVADLKAGGILSQ